MGRWRLEAHLDDAVGVAVAETRPRRSMLLGTLLGIRDLLTRLMDPRISSQAEVERLHALLEASRRLWVMADGDPAIAAGVPPWLSDRRGAGSATVGQLVGWLRGQEVSGLRPEVLDLIDTEDRTLFRGDYHEVVDMVRAKALDHRGDLESWTDTVPVPVQDSSLRGLVLNLVVASDGSRQPGSDLVRRVEGSSPHQDFLAGVRAGIWAASEVVGRTLPPKPAVFVPGLLAIDTQVVESSCGLPVALDQVARHLGLPTPLELGVLATGNLAGDGTLVPMDVNGKGSLVAKHAAVVELAQHVGGQMPVRALWFVGADGLQVARVDGSWETIRGGRTRFTVADVAEALWGTTLNSTRSQQSPGAPGHPGPHRPRGVEARSDGGSSVVDVVHRITLDRRLITVITTPPVDLVDLDDAEANLVPDGGPMLRRHWARVPSDDAAAIEAAVRQAGDAGAASALVLELGDRVDRWQAISARHETLARRLGVVVGPTVLVVDEVPTHAELGMPDGVLILDRTDGRAGDDEALDALIREGGFARLVEERSHDEVALLAAAGRAHRRGEPVDEAALSRVLEAAAPSTRGAWSAVTARTTTAEDWQHPTRQVVSIILRGRGEPGMPLAALPTHVLDEDSFWDELLRLPPGPGQHAELITLDRLHRARVGLLFDAEVDPRSTSEADPRRNP